MKYLLICTCFLWSYNAICSSALDIKVFNTDKSLTNTELVTLWVASSLGGTITTPVGSMTTDACYKIDSQSKLSQSAEVIERHFESTHSNQEFLCLPIIGLDYQEGYVYQLEVSYTYLKNKLTKVNLERILFKEAVSTFSKEETLTIWVHNQIKTTANRGSKILVQYQKALNLEGEFTAIEVPAGYIHNPKYISQITVKRTQINALRESNFNLTHQTFEDTFVAQIKKLVGNTEAWPSSILTPQTIANAKTQRKANRISNKSTLKAKTQKSSVIKYSSNKTKQVKTNTKKAKIPAKKKQPKAILASSPNIEKITMWINSSRDKKATRNTRNQNNSTSNCYEVNYNPNCRKNSFGDINIFEYTEEVKSLCLEINGFEYEPGYIYLVNATQSFIGDELTEVSLDRVITKEYDRFYEKEETLDVWIDATTLKGLNLYGEEQEYLKVQFAKKIDTNGAWQGLTHIEDFEHKPGHIYHIKMNRSYLSSFELASVTDHPGYKDTMIEILEMYKK